LVCKHHMIPHKFSCEQVFFVLLSLFYSSFIYELHLFLRLLTLWWWHIYILSSKMSRSDEILGIVIFFLLTTFTRIASSCIYISLLRHKDIVECWRNRRCHQSFADLLKIYWFEEIKLLQRLVVILITTLSHTHSAQRI